MSEDPRARVGTRIKELLISRLQVRPDVLAGCTPDTPLLGRGVGLDSVEALTLVVGIEAAFGIQVPDQDLTVELFKDIGTLADYVLKKMTNQQAG